MEVSEIIECVDIYEYISQFCELEEKQDGEYWGLSPLKEENTPSFSVNIEKQKFYDFSSGRGGNVLDFICQYHKCNFLSGLKILKEYAEISDDETHSSVSRRLQATNVAKKFRKKQKKEKESKSVILPINYMNRYDDNEEKLSIWMKEGITKQSLQRFDVKYDPFSDRIVYPIKSVDGNIINVCGRTVDPSYKEKKQRKYTYFRQLGVLDTIYGLSDNMEYILKKKELILFEGAKSVMIADGWGIKNTGAILTSHLNPYQFKILIGLGVTIVFALDSEVNIKEDVNIMKLLPYARVEWVKNRRGLLEDKDAPVDKGFEVFQKLYEERSRLR